MNSYDMNAVMLSYTSTLPFSNYVAYHPTLYDKIKVVKTNQDMIRNIHVLARTESIKYIILNNRGASYFGGRGFGIELQEEITSGNWVLESTQDNIRLNNWYDIFVDEYVSLINDVHALGKKAIFVIDVPELGVNPPDCLERNFSITKQEVTTCLVDRKVFDERNALYHKMVREIKSRVPSLIVFDPTNVFCDQEQCYGIKDNKLLYNDDDHLNNLGADMLAKEFVEFLKTNP